ncbi:unnamed protein product, partial [Polarella glacialis]
IMEGPPPMEGLSRASSGGSSRRASARRVALAAGQDPSLRMRRHSMRSMSSAVSSPEMGDDTGRLRRRPVLSSSPGSTRGSLSRDPEVTPGGSGSRRSLLAADSISERWPSAQPEEFFDVPDENNPGAPLALVLTRARSA